MPGYRKAVTSEWKALIEQYLLESAHVELCFLDY